MKRWSLIWFTLLIFIIRIPVTAQESSDIVVRDRFGTTAEHQWSSDNGQFTYYNSELGTSTRPLSVNADSAGWRSIEVATGSLSEGMYTWPLQPILTQAEQSALNPASYIHQSPDGNILFFPQADVIEGPIYDIYPLAIANRNTGQVVIFSLGVDGVPFSPNYFKVTWSDNSHALAFKYLNFSGLVLIWHLAIPDFNDLENHTLQRFDTIIINDLPYSTTAFNAVAIEDDLLDISADGQQVLLIGRDITNYDNPAELIIWNPYTGNAEVVASDFNFTAEGFVRGSFAPDGSERFLLANSRGLFLYDLSTNQTSLIRNDEDILNANYFFSPDGTWLAVMHSGDIRFVSIRDALELGE